MKEKTNVTPGFVELKVLDSQPVWVRVSLITKFYRSNRNMITYVEVGDDVYPVRQTPEEIGDEIKRAVFNEM